MRQERFQVRSDGHELAAPFKFLLFQKTRGNGGDAMNLDILPKVRREVSDMVFTVERPDIDAVTGLDLPVKTGGDYVAHHFDRGRFALRHGERRVDHEQKIVLWSLA